MREIEQFNPHLPAEQKSFKKLQIILHKLQAQWSFCRLKQINEPPRCKNIREKLELMFMQPHQFMQLSLSDRATFFIELRCKINEMCENPEPLPLSPDDFDAFEQYTRQYLQDHDADNQ